MNNTRQSSGKRHNMRSIDRLSALPDDVICHILSFLETKSSVATSILSRRWRFLWAHVPDLDFGNECRCLGTSFPDIITRVLFLHKVQSINTLCISDTYDCNKHELETWISTAVSRNVKNLEIHLGYKHKLPECLFTCKTLVYLRLNADVGIQIMGLVYLPCLKKLHLYDVQLDGDETLPHLLSGCPMLEEFIIENLMDYDMVRVNISSPTIKRLTVNFVDFSYFEIPGYRGHENRLEINAPSLEYLQLRICLSDFVSAQMLTSLIEADIRLMKNYGVEQEQDYYHVLNFLDSLCNVKCLKLSCAKVVEKGLKNWTEPFQQVPRCLLSHLRIITIDQFGFAEQEFNMVKYILRNAKVVKRMEIYFKHRPMIGLKAKFETLKRILLFERGSETYKLVFY
ncbi:hypothetical protein DH2020_031731 [Rehmannia glutinosa]|uniref:F-box domain-containing protein n=1 Tax=Rehmannia glutinosa TaxID=99300 RepID=A0ABR0VHX3_REHGL